MALVGVSALVLTSRMLARQATIWEWDDVIFCVALSVFAPHLRTPQPPFYPGFVFLGRLAKALLGDEVLALTWLSVLASCIAVVALFLLLEEWLGRRREALAGAVIFAFFPAVWFHAGSPLSDPAGLAAALTCAWLAVRARRVPSLAPAAALAFGVAMSIRPQTALIAVVPLALTLLRLPAPRRLVGITTCLASVAALYLAPVVVAGGGIGGPLRAFGYETNFVMGAESLAAPGRTLMAVLTKYLVEIWLAWPFAVLVMLLAGYGAFALFHRRRATLLELAASFLPYAVLCAVFLDPAVGGRYGLPFLPLVAVVVAVAATDLEMRFVPRQLPAIAAMVVVWPLLMMWQSLRVIHTRPSPPVAAASAIREMAGGQSFGVLYASRLFPHAQALFPGVPKVASAGAIGRDAATAGVKGWFRFGVAEEGSPTVASWPRLPAFTRVGRGRYLEVPFGPLTRLPVTFGEGWFGTEHAGSATDGASAEFRWMAARGILWLPRLAAPLRLTMEMRAPLDALARPPEVRVSVDGREIDRFAGTSIFVARAYLLEPSLLRADKPSLVEITTDQTMVPARVNPRLSDTRVLGLQVRNLRLTIERR